MLLPWVIFGLFLAGIGATAVVEGRKGNPTGPPPKRAGRSWAPAAKAAAGAKAAKAAAAAKLAAAKAAALTELQRQIGRAAFIRMNRPPPGGWPDEQDAWLKANNLTPSEVYPEWGWVTPAQAHGFGGGARVVAYFDIDANHHVNWWENPPDSNGVVKFGYKDVMPSGLAQTLKGLAADLAAVGTAFGIVGLGQFVYLLNALAGNGSPQVLASSLKQDWVNLQADEGMAEAVKDGDWQKAWDRATDNGKHLAAFAAQFAPLSPPGRDGSPPS